jgi:tRNA/rRNA methyltransferase
MPFYIYIVRCRDASYYVGHTDDLGKRIRPQRRRSERLHPQAPPRQALLVRRIPHPRRSPHPGAPASGLVEAQEEALIAGNWERLRLLSRSAAEGAGVQRARGLRLRCTQPPPVTARRFDDLSTNGCRGGARLAPPTTAD